MIPVAGIQYLINNLSLYVMLLPLYFAGCMIYELQQSYSMRRVSREKAGEPPTLADWISRGFWAALPWAVGGLVALFELVVVAAFIYAIFFPSG